MPDPKDFDNEADWMSACIPVALQEGLDQEAAKGKCYGMWQNKQMALDPAQQPTQPNQPDQTGMQPKPEKPKGKIDFMNEIKKLLEKYGVHESDEKIIEIVNSLDVQGIPMMKRFQLMEMQALEPTQERQEILVFPRGRHYVQSRNYTGWIEFNDKFYKQIAANFNDPALFKPYIDKDHEKKESYGDIPDYRIAEEGMYFGVKLNNIGVDKVKNREYRYVSPTFGDTKDTKAKEHIGWLATISLVNTPALMGLIPTLQEQLELSLNLTKKENKVVNMELQFLGKQLGKYIELQGEVSPEAIMQALPDILKMLEELTAKVQELTGANKDQQAEIAKQQEAMTAMSKDFKTLNDEKLTKEWDELSKKAIEGGMPCSEKYVELKKEEFFKSPDKVKTELAFFNNPDNSGTQLSLNGSTGLMELSKEDKELMDSTGWDSDDPKQRKTWLKTVKAKFDKEV